jgi:hypothetical protein
MKHAVEMALGGMTYMPSFLKISSVVQMLLGGIHMQTQRHAHRQQGDFVNILLLFQNKGSRIKKGDKTGYTHYRGISMLPTPYKIVSSISSPSANHRCRRNCWR